MKKAIINITSLLFTIFSIIGNSFMIMDSFKFIYKTPLLIAINALLAVMLFIIFRLLITALYNYFDKNKDPDLKSSKFIIFFEKHPFITSFIIIALCWLPYFLAFYPCILSPDPSFQIKQFFGIPNKYSNYVVLLDKNQIITNHHPVLHTLLLGNCLKLGHHFNNDNFGLFIYVIIQSIVFISTLALTIKFLKKNGIGSRYLMICLIIYALVPVFPMYTVTCVKDVFFGSYIIIFIMYLYHILHNKIDLKTIVGVFLIALLIALSRNNGIYVVILSLLPLCFIKFKTKLPILIALGLSVIFFYTYDKVVLPAFKVTNTSIREALSIPFQQTARMVVVNEDKISNKDKKIIDQVLDYDTLKLRYNAEKSDPVKNSYNRYATKTDLKNYFIVWFKGFFKVPLTYIEATVNNTYGYVYPVKTNWYIYYKEVKTINEDGFNYHYNHVFKILRRDLTLFSQGFPYLPGIGLIVNIGFNTWLLILMAGFLIIKKKFKEMTYLVPSFVILLVCFASPVNCYFRYALPFVFALPLNYGIFKLINKKEIKKEQHI